ncbi:unnamed protein product, partial [Brenthis ino]
MGVHMDSHTYMTYLLFLNERDERSSFFLRLFWYKYNDTEYSDIFITFHWWSDWVYYAALCLNQNVLRSVSASSPQPHLEALKFGISVTNQAQGQIKRSARHALIVDEADTCWNGDRD